MVKGLEARKGDQPAEMTEELTEMPIDRPLAWGSMLFYARKGRALTLLQASHDLGLTPRPSIWPVVRLRGDLNQVKSG